MAPDTAGVRATAVVVGAGELAAADLARDALERVAEEDARWHQFVSKFRRWLPQQ
jgi:hypothetical protein